ncbi:amidohydrolase family protein [Sphingosinithalassobacter tenebrarum]|uniref:Amidohydrolase family protein n=2 Tax=Stakelama tenebrarum TaxID=2711215 RepID=A0A6G6YAC6_9SPHN|nr:amidohydrolase family protein [Sphingosinithalassobacter tenebrarum]
MIGRIAAAAALLLAIAAPAAAQTRYVHAGRLIDTENGVVLTDQRVRIEDDRIVEVAPWSPPPADAEVIDWSDYTVMPGLIDMHTHLSDTLQSNNPAEPLLHSAEEIAFMGAENARLTLEAGFTSVRDVGTFRAFGDVALRDAIEAGRVAGPRMAVAGAYLTVPGGGGEVTGLAPDVTVPDSMRAGVFSGPQEMKDRARYLFQHGVDFLKIIATGAVLAEGTEPGAPEVTEEEVRAAVEEATRYGSYATAHAHGAEGIKIAIRGGVRSIEHASLIDDEGIRMARDRGVWLVMDVFNGDYIDTVGRQEGWSAEILRKNTDTTIAQRERFRKAVNAGVRIAFGTDAGVFPHGQNARQFAYMVKWGMTPMQAIQAATTSAAELMMRSQDVGVIAPGRYADMIAVRADPLADIRALESVDHVMKGGEIIR